MESSVTHQLGGKEAVSKDNCNGLQLNLECKCDLIWTGNRVTGLYLLTVMNILSSCFIFSIGYFETGVIYNKIIYINSQLLNHFSPF